MPTSAATELAALDPMPLPSGKCFFRMISTPRLLLIAFRKAITATPAVFLAASIGSLPLSPSIRSMRTTDVSVSVRMTSSPGFSTANPNTSNPQETLATVAGAKARIVFILSRIMANSDDVCKYTCSSYCGPRARSADHHRPIVITLRREQDDVIAT